MISVFYIKNKIGRAFRIILFCGEEKMFLQWYKNDLIKMLENFIKCHIIHLIKESMDLKNFKVVKKKVLFTTKLNAFM